MIEGAFINHPNLVFVRREMEVIDGGMGYEEN